MADIDVVKKGSKTWLWIVLAVVVLLAIWFFGMRNNQVRVGFDSPGASPVVAASIGGYTGGAAGV